MNDNFASLIRDQYNSQQAKDMRPGPKPKVVITQNKIDTKANLSKISSHTIDSIKLLMSCSNTNSSSVDKNIKTAQSSAEVLKQVEYLNELI